MVHLQRGLRASAFLLGLFVLACTATNKSGIYYASGKDSVTPDGLHRVLWEPFTVSFVKPGVALESYDAVVIDQVTISYRRPPKPSLIAKESIVPNFELSPLAVANMKKYFQQAFTRALTGSNTFKLAQTAGPRTLRISAHIIDLSVTAPPQNQQAGDETVYVDSSGKMTLVLDVRDSETGDPLVRVGERRAIALYFKNEYYVADATSNSIALRSLFDGWARQLTRELDQLRSIPKIPTLPKDHGKG